MRLGAGGSPCSSSTRTSPASVGSTGRCSASAPRSRRWSRGRDAAGRAAAPRRGVGGHPPRRRSRPSPSTSRGDRAAGRRSQREPARRGDPRRRRGRARGSTRCSTLLARPDVDYVSVKISAVCARASTSAGVRRTRVERIARAAARALPPRRRARPAEVRQPRHGGVPRPRPHRRRVPRVLDEPEFRAPRRRHRAAGVPARLARRRSSARRRGRAARRAPRRRADQGAPRQGRQPGDGAGRGRAARLGRRRRTRPRPRSTPATSALLDVALRPDVVDGACASASPATTCSTSPGRSCCASELRAAARPRSRSRCSRAWRRAQAARRRAPTPAGCCCTRRSSRAERLRRRDRLPRAPPRREHRARELPARTCSTSRAGSRGVRRPGASASRASVADRHTGRPRRAARQDRRAERPRRRPAGAPFANEPDTDFTVAANRAWIADAPRRRRARRRRSTPTRCAPTIGRRRRGASTRRRGRRRPALGCALARARRAERRSRRVARRSLRRATAADDDRGDGRTRRGKTVAEGDPEVSEAIDFARYYAARGRRLDQLDGAAAGAARRRSWSRRRGTSRSRSRPAACSPRSPPATP